MKKTNHVGRIIFAFFLFGFVFFPIGTIDIGIIMDSINHRKFKNDYKSAHFIVDDVTLHKRTLRGSSSEKRFEMTINNTKFYEWDWTDGITANEGYPDLVRTQVPIGAVWARQINGQEFDVIPKQEKGALIFRPQAHGTYGVWWVHLIWVFPLLFLIFRIYQAIKSMRSKTTFISVFLCIIFFMSYSQDVKFQGDRVLLGNQSSMQDLVFSLYKPTLQAKMIYRYQSEAKNESPETLISSIMSASSQEWVDYNTLGGAQKSKKILKEALERTKNADREKVFFELTSKMNFKANGSEMCIIKFFIHSDGLPKPFSGTYLFQKIGSRWYHTATPWATNLMIMMMSFDDNKLATLLKGQPTGEKLMDELIKKVNNKIFDLNKLYQEYDSWCANKDAIKKDYFLDKNTWGY